MPERIYLGVDPGASGAIAAITPAGVCWVKLSETPADVSDFLRDLKAKWGREVIGCLERVNAMPGQGVSSTFKFGWSAGFVEGLLVAHGVPFSHVSPAKWQGALGCRTGGDKNVSKRRAQELWPGTKITHTNADALLLAEYARRTEVRGDFDYDAAIRGLGEAASNVLRKPFAPDDNAEWAQRVLTKARREV